MMATCDTQRRDGLIENSLSSSLGKLSGSLLDHLVKQASGRDIMKPLEYKQ